MAKRILNLSSFDKLSQGAQNVFRSVKNECVVFVSPGRVAEQNRWYIKHRGETTVYAWRDGMWQPIKTY